MKHIYVVGLPMRQAADKMSPTLTHIVHFIPLTMNKAHTPLSAL